MTLDIDRALFTKKLDEVREARNDVMHFEPEVVAPRTTRQGAEFCPPVSINYGFRPPKICTFFEQEYRFWATPLISVGHMYRLRPSRAPRAASPEPAPPITPHPQNSPS